MLRVSGRGRHSFSVSAEVPGKRAGTVNELDDRRRENEVRLCCLSETHNASDGCARTPVAGNSQPVVTDSHHWAKTNPTTLCCSFERRMRRRFSSLAVLHVIKVSLCFFP